MVDFNFSKFKFNCSFSTVYKVKERTTEREFAIKVCIKQQILRERKIEQIYREKEALARLSKPENRHAFFLQIYCTFQDSDSLYIVTTLAKGGDLLRQLKKRIKFDTDITKFCASEIVVALGHMHRLKIIHRDLKPENILLSAIGHILISDFGSSKLQSQNRIVDFQQILRRRKCSFVGTAQYVSPEVLCGQLVQQACDYWALGVIIYQFLTGRHAFYEASEYIMYKKICHASYEMPADFSLETRHLIEQLIVVNPAERLGSVESGGVEHEFFKGIDWSNIEQCQSPFRIYLYFFINF
ncbi:unnamed protein product [Dracunculus medinensis]|uniref:non-specific serine/threonine protein kinase n=1 Tax=Dracunculus medinensis TaxID=318479 RepID=A0A3P7QFV9_DRAME|nr:unnamed protein product [Dracunculus medinensis]